MPLGHKCDICRALREKASAAINRHLQAAGRRELARLRHNSELLAALGIVVDEAAAAREQAVTALKQHLHSHRAGTPPSDVHTDVHTKEAGAGSSTD